MLYERHFYIKIHFKVIFFFDETSFFCYKIRFLNTIYGTSYRLYYYFFFFLLLNVKNKTKEKRRKKEIIKKTRKKTRKILPFTIKANVIGIIRF